MGLLLSCQSIGKTFGPKVLFEDLSFGVNERDKLAIIGPNGSGKSSLLKILAGELSPDEGKVTANKGLKVVYVEQQSNFNPNHTLLEALEHDLHKCGMDTTDLFGIANNSLGRLGFFDFDQKVSSLSGGWRKRLSFACALAREPALLLLDEPTNHLDLEGIEWLEKVLKNANFAWVLITHDRYFLESIATRIIEVNRVYKGGLFSVDGGYGDFLTAKAEYISGQQQAQESLANKVRREVEWLRRGPKARTTKQQARIQSAGELQGELAEISSRTRETKVQINFNASERKTKKLVSLKNISKSFGARKVIDDFTFTLTAGTKLGLLGLNASGKTTLLKILAGTSQPDAGSVEQADRLRVVYFEQNRERLDPNLSVKRTLAPDSDSVIANERSVHVVSWARKFNFLPEQLDQPVGKLSGGEQARLLIAKLMLEPADVLLLDEPTNDLDIPTLEVLEESLDEFKGAVVLVTHDRYMLDRVSNLLLALDGSGGILDFADYAQWQAFQKQKSNQVPRGSSASSMQRSGGAAPAKPSKKLSYMEQRELDQMEENIAKAEAALEKCQSDANDPAIASSSAKLQQCYAALEAAQKTVETLYERWALLEEKTRS